MKLGKYAYPDVSLPESIEDAKKIYDRFKDQKIDQELVSETIGYKGGTFIQRLAALRKYGLVTPRGKVQITDLGKKITYPENRERKLETMEKAIQNVELFKALYTEFDFELPKEKFWVNLVNITGAEAPDAQEKEDEIRQIYMDSVKSLTSRKRTISPPPELPEFKEVPSDFFTFETDDFKIQIRKNLKTFQFVKERLIETIRPLLEYEESKIEEQKKKK